jgi:hypothetical protein
MSNKQESNELAPVVPSQPAPVAVVPVVLEAASVVAEEVKRHRSTWVEARRWLAEVRRWLR